MVRCSKGNKYFFLICLFTIACVWFSPSRAFSQQNVIDSLENLLKTAGDTNRVNILIRLSGQYYRKSPQKCIEISAEALELARKTGFRRGMAKSHNMLGVGYSSLGNYSLGLENYLEALRIFEELGENTSVGITSNNIGIIHKNLGNYSEAITYYQKSLSISEQSGNSQGTIIALNNIGNIYYDWQKYDFALDYFRRTLAMLKNSGDNNRIAVLLNNIGEVYYNKSVYDTALNFFSRSLSMSEALGSNKGILNSYRNMGELFCKMKNDRKALENYQRALKIAGDIGDRHNIAYLSVRIGEVYTSTGRSREALPYLKRGLEMAESIEASNLVKDAYFELSNYFAANNVSDSALYYFKKYSVEKDTLFNRESRKELTEMQTRYETEKKEREIQIQKLRIQKQQNTMYYILFTVAFLIVILYLIFNRYQLKQKHYRAELQRKNIEIEQRLLRTQMNPHFIFNSLNSINSFITENEPDSAQLYLTKFASLMRYILDNSRKSFVPVEDERNTLKLNLELEQLRFNHKFDFRIEIAGDIDPEFTLIPPMLIQPFIENSIIHGVSNLEGRGMITVSLKKMNGIMECVVEDNGIGREKAMEIKKQKGVARHKSLGMQVTRERLELLREKSKKDVFVKISDIQAAGGTPGGTRVEIHIPYEEE
ncbi:MAG: tetratricopeptide repeat protein [Bacteroidales bacterium]|nr:tetratricopeptide repeat protein [Bacteroidales bacterium]